MWEIKLKIIPEVKFIVEVKWDAKELTFDLLNSKIPFESAPIFFIWNVSSYKLIPPEVTELSSQLFVYWPCEIKSRRLWCRTLFLIFELFFQNILLLHSLLYFSLFRIITIMIFLIIFRFKHITNSYFKTRQICHVKLKDLIKASNAK